MVNQGDCPTLMLNAPVPAARKALAKASLAIDDIDVWEINEAFSVVSEKVYARSEHGPGQGEHQRRRHGPGSPHRRPPARY